MPRKLRRRNISFKNARNVIRKTKGGKEECKEFLKGIFANAFIIVELKLDFVVID